VAVLPLVLGRSRSRSQSFGLDHSGAAAGASTDSTASFVRSAAPEAFSRDGGATGTTTPGRAARYLARGGLLSGDAGWSGP
jgi:hypothetical protein